MFTRLRAVAVAAVALVVSACATTGGLSSGADLTLAKARYGAEAVFHVGGQAGIAAVDAGLPDRRRDQLDALAEPAIQALFASRAAETLGRSADATSQAFAVMSLVAQGQALFAAGTPDLKAVGTQAPDQQNMSVLGALQAATGLVATAGPIASEARQVLASDDAGAVRGATAALIPRNDALIETIRARIAARTR